jgi:hypothetical protein
MQSKSKITIACLSVLLLGIAVAATFYGRQTEQSASPSSSPQVAHAPAKATAAADSHSAMPDPLPLEDVFATLPGYRLGERIETFDNKAGARALLSANGEVLGFVRLQAAGLPITFRLSESEILFASCAPSDFIPGDPGMHNDCTELSVLDTRFGKVAALQLPGHDAEFQPLAVRGPLLAYLGEGGPTSPDSNLRCRVYDWRRKALILDEDTGRDAIGSDVIGSNGWPFFAKQGKVVCAVRADRYTSEPELQLYSTQGEPMSTAQGGPSKGRQFWHVYPLPVDAPLYKFPATGGAGMNVVKPASAGAAVSAPRAVPETTPMPPSSRREQASEPQTMPRKEQRPLAPSDGVNAAP